MLALGLSVCYMVCICMCAGEGDAYQGEGQDGHTPWWTGPYSVANDNLNLVLLIGDEALELV